MLKGTPLATALVLGGCLWEPVQEETTITGNADVAPIIQVAFPTRHEIAVDTSPSAPPCELSAGFTTVYSPRGTPLTARFLLNWGDDNATQQPLAIGGNGQIDFPLQGSPSNPTLYALPSQEILLTDFLMQLNSPTNVLWAFVSDDFQDCPYPTTEVPSQSPGSQTLDCFTTSWSWVIDLSGCAFVTTP